MPYQQLNKVIGNIDIYLLDQILKGRFENSKRLLDAGCGEGRNLRYFIDSGVEVHGCDTNPMAIKMAQMTYKTINKDHFKVCSIEDMDYDNASFDCIVCTAVLHFATNEDHFKNMLLNLVRVLKPKGKLFIRMATDVGVDNDISGFTYILPKTKIESSFAEFGLQFIEPWKSVVVNDQRSMGVFILSKI